MNKTHFKFKSVLLNRAVSFTVLVMIMGLFNGCPQNGKLQENSKPDKTPPKEVTKLQAEASTGAVRLTWTDPADADLWGIEISSEQEIVGRFASPIQENTIMVAKGQQSIKIANLSAGISYIFTVKTIDLSGNKSAGISTAEAVTPTAGDPMSLTLSQSPENKVWTKGNVTISFTSSTSVKTAKWTKGVKSAKDVLASGTGITGQSFEVSENGIYSVAVQDNEGRREVEMIEIKNIDKIPPSQVKNLKASYDLGTKKIALTWDALSDACLKNYLVSYKKGGTPVVTEQEEAGTSFSIKNVEADGAEYEFSIKAVDKAGNKGEEAKISVTASAVPSLTKIDLNNRKHLAYNDPDRTIKVTLTGSNFNLIASQADSTVKAGIYDGNSLQGSLVTVTSIDIAKNEASVDLTAPSLSSGNASFEGKTYTVKVKLCGAYSPVTESFVITKEARLTKNPELSLKTIASNEVTMGTKTKITVTGANLAVAGGIRVRLYNSEGVVEGEEIVIDASSQAAGTVSSFEADIPVPQKEGVFTAKVFFGSTEQKKIYSDPSSDYGKDITNPAIQVYGAPKFTSFYIPKAGISAEDVKLIARVRGTNFEAPGITESNFTVDCIEKPSITNGSAVTILSDSELKVTLTIPGQAGSYTVKITSGSQALEGSFDVKDYGDYSEYTAGKIVLKDGSLVAQDTYTEINAANPPVAVLIGAQHIYGVALGIGLHISASELSWAKYLSTGYNTIFKDIICTPSATGNGAASTAAFTGDLDGSDNWDYICSIDPEGSANAAENYPAFDWVNTYNTTYAGTLAGADIGWYMPSLAELCEVYKNKDVINQSLAKIRGLGSTYADASLGTSWLWSSSQGSNYNDDNAWRVFFSNGYVDDSSKYLTNRVCCLSGF